MLKKLFILLLIIINISCSHKAKAIEESYFITSEYSGTAYAKGDMLFKLKFSDSLLQQDTINMSYFKYAHHDIEDSYVALGLPDDYQLKSAERHTIFTPTLKNFAFPEAGMFMKLDNLAYTAKRPIYEFNPVNYKTRIYKDSPDATEEDLKEIEENHKIFLESENVLHYPAIHLNGYIKDNFLNITQDQLSAAIQNEIEKDPEMTKEEKSFWESNLRKYKKGAFTETKDPFDIMYYTVYLDLELIKDDKSINKVLEYNISLGP